MQKKNMKEELEKAFIVKLKLCFGKQLLYKNLKPGIFLSNFCLLFIHGVRVAKVP